jgi:hypothetical protein
MYGPRGCTGRPGVLDCQNCSLPVTTRGTIYYNVKMGVQRPKVRVYYPRHSFIYFRGLRHSLQPAAAAAAGRCQLCEKPSREGYLFATLQKVSADVHSSSAAIFRSPSDERDGCARVQQCSLHHCRVRSARRGCGGTGLALTAPRHEQSPTDAQPMRDESPRRPVEARHGPTAEREAPREAAAMGQQRRADVPKLAVDAAAPTNGRRTAQHSKAQRTAQDGTWATQ